MCGIAGYVTAERNETTLERMLDLLKHRGPDDRGMRVERVADRYVHLGHTRLSILDLSSRGHQPFASPCGDYLLSYNGEIYNFAEIRAELEKRGHRFRSRSDTEVLLAAWMEWGEGALERFVGMFAFALLDRRHQRLTLVRDRAGVKPLYYRHDGRSFLFASELKALHPHPAFTREIDHRVLSHYFRHGYIPAPHSIYEKCRKLSPGEILVLDIPSGRVSTRRYWSIDACYRKPLWEKSREEILDELEGLLTDAVDKRMVSDVPVGVFLSGGIDSSLVTALLKRHRNRPLLTFTIGFREEGYDETVHARRVARFLGTEHYERTFDPSELPERIEAFAYHYDEPFGDSSALPTMLLSELARSHVKVALSADGGDELFGGYSKYLALRRIAPLLERPRGVALLRSILSRIDAQKAERFNRLMPRRLRQSNLREKFEKLRRSLAADSPEELFRLASSYADPTLVERLLAKQGEPKSFDGFSMEEGIGFGRSMMRIDYRTFLADDLLTKVDRATMSVSLEGREPLLDHRIAEYMARIPEETLYGKGGGKPLAKSLLARHLPSSVFLRPKAGFQAPLERWMRTEFRELIERTLAPGRIDGELLDPSTVHAVKASVLAGDPTHTHLLWFLLAFHLWRERWG
jgi:asparagine synthase (glutamine-hydrolysing)